jgi:predicted Zn-dependent protease
MFVVAGETTSVNMLRNVTVHELGHTLGYYGHSAEQSKTMARTESTIYTLSENERKHLRQVYDYFR